MSYTCTKDPEAPGRFWLVSGPGIEIVVESETTGRLVAVHASSARAVAVEACAREVAAAGCLCLPFNSAENYEDEYPGQGFKCNAVIDFHLPAEERVIRHDPRCPIALAARLREIGR